ncbi:hypothetical protein C7999DRAFT_18213 [Corynascus novoguineensis]|uniref:Uncharacterized protein n=1 Tax=Corynascus novoguineensis TaxID=1126955 RepID=A0AAN7CKQ2_9PEZI|nr:hypothetical protein C7999DRAFT_18213 [Corynascus novoguineensis]
MGVPELEVCSQKHQILAVADESDGNGPVLFILYHWRPPSVRTIALEKLSPRLLSTIKNAVSLGTFFLEDDLEVSETFSELLAAQPENPEPTAQLFSALVSQLPAPNRGTRMQFFTFPVLGDSSDQVIGEGCFPVWKWVKPESMYPRKRGVWETKLHKALDDGEWNAGKDLILLVRGVSEHGLQAVERAGYTTASLESIISKSSNI